MTLFSSCYLCFYQSKMYNMGSLSCSYRIGSLQKKIKVKIYSDYLLVEC